MLTITLLCLNSSALSLTSCRTYALHKHRPISLYPTIHPPSLDEVPSDRPIAVGLELMINMFKNIDDTFVNLWNRVHNTHVSPAWITQVQTQLSEAVPAYFECTEAQEVEIRITQQWLRSQVWQLSVCQGLVSSVSNDSPLTFKYPIDIARDLLTISHQFSQQAMEVHGVGLVSTYCFRYSSPVLKFGVRLLSQLSMLVRSMHQSLPYCDLSRTHSATSISDVRAP
jgi:hypothetical protein